MELVNALGRFKYIKQEDQGNWLTRDQCAQPPDYLVGDNLGRRLAVEVKNCHKVTGNFSLRADIISQLEAYADIVGHRLKFAIFWSRWREWTLVDPSFFKQSASSPDRKTIAFGDAVIVNEMNALGDVGLYTKPPLCVRAKFTRLQSKKGPIDEFSFMARIDAIKITAAGRVLDRALDRRICLHLMFYGSWPSHDWTVQNIDGDEYFVLESSPPPGPPSCSIPGYASIGNLSRHFSNAALGSLTAEQVEIPEGVGGLDHAHLGNLIPPDFDFHNSGLDLIVFHVIPRDIPPGDESAWKRQGSR